MENLYVNIDKNKLEDLEEKYLKVKNSRRFELKKHDSLERFKSNPNILVINNNFYLFSNFMGKEYEEYANYAISSLNESIWFGQHFRYKIDDFIESDGRNLTIGVAGRNLEVLYQDISNFFNPEYNIINFTEISRTRPLDNNTFNGKVLLNIKSIDYVIIYFLGNFIGGELYFPQNNFTYSPKNDDLFIFPKEYFEDLIVKDVISGVKYTYLNYAIKEIGTRFV
jgi:hypothetical protein